MFAMSAREARMILSSLETIPESESGSPSLEGYPKPPRRMGLEPLVLLPRGDNALVICQPPTDGVAYDYLGQMVQVGWQDGPYSKVIDQLVTPTDVWLLLEDCTEYDPGFLVINAREDDE